MPFSRTSRTTSDTLATLRDTAPAWAALALAALLAWHATLEDARMMGGMAGTMGMPLPSFLAMWSVMMAAMMFPSVAPLAILWVRAQQRRSGRVLGFVRAVLFVGGYLLAWCSAGLLAFVGLNGLTRLLELQPGLAGWAGAVLFGMAGVYQLTPLKDWCLRHCRSPVALLSHYSAHRGPLADVWIGVHHGLFCLACCWGLMVVLAATGLMNVAAMVVLTAVVLLEKVWRHGRLIARGAGVVLLGLAVLAWYRPGLFAGLSV